ncbi:hypothetical protein [Taibaiella soli]|uniref:Uncharacterized protein n=1 Tax=Taibaiella soli TaxID=1649169 RepID=A0A2W2C413_9BACT|nr:hypothetical protein [Taibaiella soli]PZF74863.1 hypothetical protein DN068_01315 [Taibaiella soli]
MEKTKHIEAVRKAQIELEELGNRNIRLKEELSEAVRREVNAAFVEKAERFQQSFLEKDQIIALLRHDARILIEKLKLDIATDADLVQCTRLKADVRRLASNASENTLSFQSFLANEPAN